MGTIAARHSESGTSRRKEFAMGILVLFFVLFALTMLVHGSRIVRRDF